MDEQIQDEDAGSAADVQQQLTAAKAEAEANLNGWKRSEADFQNYQRRKEAENKELVEFAREVAVAKLLPSLDSLQQALRQAPKLGSGSSPREERLGEVTDENGGSTNITMTPANSPPSGGGQDHGFSEKYQTWLTGIDGLVKQLDKALEELGVKKIEALGKKFDPNFHEAVREVPGEEDGVVLEEYQTGFELNGKVIRPSQVAISKKR